eukprot:678390-Prorocentrum_lima.AAC.1
MTSSLVGSEMCIRDRVITKDIAKQKKWDRQQAILQHLWEEVLPKNKWHCLLYTSDAADDM